MSLGRQLGRHEHSLWEPFLSAQVFLFAISLTIAPCHWSKPSVVQAKRLENSCTTLLLSCCPLWVFLLVRTRTRSLDAGFFRPIFMALRLPTNLSFSSRATN